MIVWDKKTRGQGLHIPRSSRKVKNYSFQSVKRVCPGAVPAFPLLKPLCSLSSSFLFPSLIPSSCRSVRGKGPKVTRPRGEGPNTVRFPRYLGADKPGSSTCNLWILCSHLSAPGSENAFSFSVTCIKLACGLFCVFYAGCLEEFGGRD